MLRRQSAIINKCCVGNTEKIGAYRVIHNTKWTIEELIDNIKVHTKTACADSKHVLCIQDTKEQNYDNLSGRLDEDDPDFGYGTMNKHEFSIFLHPTMVIDADTQQPLSYSSVRIWNREAVVEVPFVLFHRNIF